MYYNKNNHKKTATAQEKRATLKLYAEASEIGKNLFIKNDKSPLKMDLNQKMKYKTEIDEAPLTEFLKFELGAAVEVTITGTREIKTHEKVETFFVAEYIGKKYILPNNIMLSRKIKNLVNMNSNEFPVNCCIEHTGFTKIEGVANKVKTFAVFA